MTILRWFTTTVFFVIAILPTAATVTSGLIGTPHLFEALSGILFTQRVLGLFWQSWQIGWWASLCSLTLGVPVGFLICRTDIHFRKLAQYAMLLPLAIPPYIGAIAWIKLLAPRIYGPAGVVWVLTLSYFPFISLLTAAGLVSSDRALEEQAELIVGRWPAIRAITVPMIRPFILAGALFVLVFSVSNYGVPALLRVTTYPIEIFTQYSAFYDHRVAGLTVLPLLLLTGAAVVLSHVMMKDRCYVSITGIGRAGRLIALGRCRLVASLLVWLVIVVSGLLPLGTLVVASGSVRAYWMALSASGGAIMTSLGLSVMSASACVGLGYGLAYVIARSRWRGRRGLDIATMLPLAVPGTVLGIGLIELWNRRMTSVVYSGFLIVVLGMVARFVPFAVRILSSGFSQMNPHLEEAAALTGARLFARTCRIVAPLMKSGLLATASLCFIFSMAEIEMTLLVMPPGSETLASRLYTLMHYDVGPFTVASCVVLVVCSIVPVGVLGYASTRGVRHD